MNTIVKMEFGSTVYGTRIPTSDVDIKGVYLPQGNDILLGRVKDAINLNTKLGSDSKNTADDKDEEYYSLQKYVNLLLEGQTVSLDMLFVPEKHIIYNDCIVWNEIQRNKDKFLHSGYSSFVGYCKTQANKYGIKGSRMNAVKKVIEYLTFLQNDVGSHKKLFQHKDVIETFVMLANDEFIKIVELLNAQKTGLEPYLEVCNRKVAFHATIKYALQTFQKIYDEYGVRSKAAESNQGVDWKALGHAVRIANQAKELLLTHNVTFPRPEADLLLQIRKGELPYKQVAELIEEGLAEIVIASEKSTLPKEPNRKWAEQLVLYCYRGVVTNE
jgi:hypothetical protein